MAQNEPENILTLDLNCSEANQKVAYPNLESTFMLFFALLLFTLIIAIPTGILLAILDNPHSNSSVLRSLLNLLMYITSLLITIRYAIRKSKKQQGYSSRINFNKIQGWLIPLIIISALALIIPLYQTSSWIPMPKWVQKLFEKTFAKDIFSIITMVIAAPILEEILCRGIILKGLLKNYQPYKAIIISAIFFGAIHLNPWQAIPAFLNGLFLGWIYYKTQSVIPGMIIHATVNITATSFLFLPSHWQDLSSFLGMFYYFVACPVSILIFAATCIIIHKKALTIPGPINFN